MNARPLLLVAVAAATLATACGGEDEQDPQPPPPDPHEQVIGDWHSEARGDELQLQAGGKAHARIAGSELSGHYRWVADDELELELSAPSGLETKAVRSVEVSEARLELTSEQGRTVVYARK